MAFQLLAKKEPLVQWETRSSQQGRNIKITDFWSNEFGTGMTPARKYRGITGALRGAANCMSATQPKRNPEPMCSGRSQLLPQSWASGRAASGCRGGYRGLPRGRALAERIWTMARPLQEVLLRLQTVL
jgi:hypothetical protein